MKSKTIIPTLSAHVDIENGEVGNVARDPYGKPLFPDPTTDELDPLNWPTWRKYVIIFIVCYGYFMVMYCNTAPVVAFVQLQSQFNASYSEINWTFAAGNLGAAVGPLFFSATAEIIGRRPVMIFGTLLGLVGTGWSAAHGISIESYALARLVQVFGTTPAITVGLAIINDLSWQHERGFRVGLWVLAIDTSCFLGPLCMNSLFLFVLVPFLIYRFSWLSFGHSWSVLGGVPYRYTACGLIDRPNRFPARDPIPKSHGSFVRKRQGYGINQY